MIGDATALASNAFLIADTLREDYGIDSDALLEKYVIDAELRDRPGERLPDEVMDELWRDALELSGDSAFGIKVGNRAIPTSYYVLGYSWHASASLKDGMERLIRFNAIVNTTEASYKLEKKGKQYRLSESPAEGSKPRDAFKVDAEMAGFMMLCEAARGERVNPLRVELMGDVSPHQEAHAALFNAPIEYGASEYALYFDAEIVEAPLESAIPDVAEATDKIAEHYLDKIDYNKVTGQVRQLLIQMLPAGSADQEGVAARLYRSSSTLQRQLHAEGTSYRDVLEDTRSDLAKEYLRDGDYTHAQVAYMLGFSDQSNFSRAFKRWTGMSPGQYQKSLEE